MQFSVSDAEDGERLDRILSVRIPTVSRMRLRQALDQQEVRVDGEPRPAGWRARAGALVRVDAELEAATAMTPEAMPLSVLYEDPHLIVVEKPAGIVVHPAGAHRSGTLINGLAYHFNVAGAADPPVRPGLVHRLDRATSGLMVVAKTQQALSRLTVQFQEKRVRKRYLALVVGVLESEAGEWEAPIGSDSEAMPRWGIRDSGRPAQTRFWVRETLAAHTLLELEPVTGRTNQLRLHSAHFGHPIAGDELFGAGLEPGLSRLFLHAHRLEFTHPETRQPQAYESALPEELTVFLGEARQQGTG
jgi:23S rRNA pseudouridine1911/1915/1917 synthase